MPDVVIVDDQPLIRSAIRGLLDADPHVTVVGEAGDGVEALEVIATTTPDVVLMDIRMPRLDGIRTTAALCADDRFTDTRVLVLTTFEEDRYVVAALRAGPAGSSARAPNRRTSRARSARSTTARRCSRPRRRGR